ncbi:MauE/DoxX family redox-associated membrane protein [Staphylococcus hominis]|uniref:MauE/DoxX family redox-associated membrane protein n=1 Tax=Staphylococcus hominis TaxID=1290 RepID=UPI00398B3104
MYERSFTLSIILGILVNYSLIILFFSGFFKLLSFKDFTLNTYEILNNKISMNVITISSYILIFMELSIPLIILLQLNIEKWELFLVSSLYLFTLIILLIAIYIGNKGKSCGCYGTKFKSNISWKKVIENFLLCVIFFISIFFNIHISYISIIFSLVLVIIYFLKIYKRSY